MNTTTVERIDTNNARESKVSSALAAQVGRDPWTGLETARAELRAAVVELGESVGYDPLVATEQYLVGSQHATMASLISTNAPEVYRKVGRAVILTNESRQRLGGDGAPMVSVEQVSARVVKTTIDALLAILAEVRGDMSPEGRTTRAQIYAAAGYRPLAPKSRAQSGRALPKYWAFDELVAAMATLREALDDELIKG